VRSAYPLFAVCLATMAAVSESVARSRAAGGLHPTASAAPLAVGFALVVGGAGWLITWGLDSRLARSGSSHLQAWIVVGTALGACLGVWWALVLRARVVHRHRWSASAQLPFPILSGSGMLAGAWLAHTSSPASLLFVTALCSTFTTLLLAIAVMAGVLRRRQQVSAADDATHV
jgi:hypothetical protein